MTELRVLHQLRNSSLSGDELSRSAADVRGRPGALESEAYVCTSDSNRSAIVQLWEDETAYTEFRRGRGTDSVTAAIDDPEVELTTEFYARCPYRQNGAAWTPVSHGAQSSVIEWPAAGAVRAIIAVAAPSVPEVDSALDADCRATRREPGCEQYAYFRGTEHPEDLLLLELWVDQRHYDAHWGLRVDTGGDEKPPSPPRILGKESIEFYRHSPFVHLYDRWMPSESQAWSRTISWPC
ncbi:MAG: antibiotic biosynthesis monooxygenase [Rhodococcus sp. (in: high G+C Gram-positive bacteria)]|uniref:putative quinol monooxygenase n=1 Tax=Rhodococcus sp. TaxID=1831 RepID=UPI002AD7A0AA|nr:antibiotic biosynthesis monooxygenase [Rhodococcus sp. (in: high G+C Gram-positive bacteria)]